MSTVPDSAQETLETMRVLDGVIRRDRAPPGFEARIALGVIGRPTLFWGAEVRRDRIEASFFTELPIFSEWDAALIVCGRSVIGEGDLAIVDRLIARYLTPRNCMTANAEQIVKAQSSSEKEEAHMIDPRKGAFDAREILQHRLAIQLARAADELPTDSRARTQRIATLADPELIVSPLYVEALARTLALKSDSALRDWIERSSAPITSSAKAHAAEQLRDNVGRARNVDEQILEIVVDPELDIATKALAYCLCAYEQSGDDAIRDILHRAGRIFLRAEDVGSGDAKGLGEILLVLINNPDVNPLRSVLFTLNVLANELGKQGEAAAAVAKDVHQLLEGLWTRAWPEVRLSRAGARLQYELAVALSGKSESLGTNFDDRCQRLIALAADLDPKITPFYVMALARTIALKSDDEVRDWIERTSVPLESPDSTRATLDELTLAMAVDPEIDMADKAMFVCMNASHIAKDEGARDQLHLAAAEFAELGQLGTGDVDQMARLLLPMVNNPGATADAVEQNVMQLGTAVQREAIQVGLQGAGSGSDRMKEILDEIDRRIDRGSSSKFPWI